MISMVIGLIYGTEGIILINTLYLKETFDNITVFVAFNVTIDVMFNIKYPFVINNIYMRLARVRIHVPLCIKVKNSSTMAFLHSRCLEAEVKHFSSVVESIMTMSKACLGGAIISEGSCLGLKMLLQDLVVIG
jgi:hypothetical protein